MEASRTTNTCNNTANNRRKTVKGPSKDRWKTAKLSSKEGTDQGSIFGMKGALEKDLNMLANKDYLKSFNKVVDIKTMELIRNKLLFANKVYSTGLENSIVNKVVKDKTMQEFAKKQDKRNKLTKH